MTRHGSAPKFSGDERVRSEGNSLLKKLLEVTRPSAPKIVDKEAIKAAKKTVASEVKTEFNVALSQIFGIELKPGKSHSLAKKSEEAAQKMEKKAVMTQEHMEYFSDFKRTTENKNQDEATIGIRQQLDSILAELRNLKNSSDELENVFKDVAIDTPPEKPGIYHLTFFEGFLKLVIKMRDNVQDGVTYAKLFRGRKQERSYAAMAKKGGTSFTLHHDRTPATQTG